MSVDDFRPHLADALAVITTTLTGEAEVTTVLGLVTDACASVLGADSSGVLLADPRGGLEVVAATEEHSLLVEVLQAQTDQGPCVDCVREDSVIADFDLTRATPRWPRFAPAAVQAGYRAVIAVPMRLHMHPIGGLNLLYSDPPPTDSGAPTSLGWRANLARVFADLAVLALVQDRGDRRTDRLVEQALGTVNDRMHLSQAAGVVAAATGLDPHEAMRAVRSYAGRLQRPLSEVVRSITENHLDPGRIAEVISGRTTEPGPSGLPDGS